MQIPLDYYRILGIPMAASDEQLAQAYDDRIVGLPRREYSSPAIGLADSKEVSLFFQQDQQQVSHFQ